MNTPKHISVLSDAQRTLAERGERYGGVEDSFERISHIASLILDRPVSKREVAIILHSVKLGRMPGDPHYEDNYVDGINYLAFAAEFAALEAELNTGPEVSTPLQLDPDAFLGRIREIASGSVDAPSKCGHVSSPATTAPRFTGRP